MMQPVRIGGGWATDRGGKILPERRFGNSENEWPYGQYKEYVVVCGAQVSAPGYRKVSVTALFSKAKTRFQSFFILMTNQPCFFASSYRASVKVPTLVSRRPRAGP